MTYLCRLHSGDFSNEIPEDAIKFSVKHGRGNRGRTFPFADGTIHNLLAESNLGKSVHTRYHSKKPKQGCQYCFPIQKEVPSGPGENCGQPDIALTAEAPLEGNGHNDIGQLLAEVAAEALEELSTPTFEPDTLNLADEDQDENAAATMAHAFRNRR